METERRQDSLTALSSLPVIHQVCHTCTVIEGETGRSITVSQTWLRSAVLFPDNLFKFFNLYSHVCFVQYQFSLPRLHRMAWAYPLSSLSFVLLMVLQNISVLANAFCLQKSIIFQQNCPSFKRCCGCTGYFISPVYFTFIQQDYTVVYVELLPARFHVCRF